MQAAAALGTGCCEEWSVSRSVLAGGVQVGEAGGDGLDTLGHCVLGGFDYT